MSNCAFDVTITRDRFSSIGATGSDVLMINVRSSGVSMPTIQRTLCFCLVCGSFIARFIECTKSATTTGSPLLRFNPGFNLKTHVVLSGFDQLSAKREI